MAKVESITLDHTKVKAPYVRLITEEKGKIGDLISNYDLRLVQPNANAIPSVPKAEPAIAALPHPKSTKIAVPINSHKYFFIKNPPSLIYYNYILK